MSKRNHNSKGNIVLIWVTLASEIKKLFPYLTGLYGQIVQYSGTIVFDLNLF